MSDAVTFSVTGDIAHIQIANPPVNALGHAVRDGLVKAVEAFEASDAKIAIVHGDGRCFSAGADIKEFGKPPVSPWLPEVVDRLESCSKPLVAALHGTTLGGGFEVALGCHYRCAVPEGVVGLPEVKLGLLPGAGGTQRSPRLAGVQAALDLMVSGKPIPAGKAAKVGLVDRVVDGDLLEAAEAYARELLESGAGPRRVSDMSIDAPEAGFFDEYSKAVAKKTRGLEAPQRIIECVKAAVNKPFADGMEVERSQFMECMASDQSAALRHVFAAQREAAKIADIPADTAHRSIKHVGIVGAGTMGGGIAMCFANTGFKVTLIDMNTEGLDRGLGIIRKNYEISAKKGRFTEEQVASALGAINGSTQYADLADCDMVIEAVFEDLDLKKKVFGELDNICKSGAILATNTSYQDVNAIAAATSRPGDVVGTHFFSPANVMKLLEVVRADKTADDVIATVMAVGKKIGKVPVLSGVCYGFIGNRMLTGYFREAQKMLMEGATPEKIDSVMENWGMAMGPLAVCDLAGLDVGYRARQSRDKELGITSPKMPGDELVEAGRLGQKSGAGFYSYDPETRRRIPDAEVVEKIHAMGKERGIEQRDIEDQEIIERCIYPLVNEGARILAEGIAQRPGDIDIVYLYGYGFPAHRGGPMFYAKQQGIDEVAAAIGKYRNRFGEDEWPQADLAVIG